MLFRNVGALRLQQRGRENLVDEHLHMGATGPLRQGLPPVHHGGTRAAGTSGSGVNLAQEREGVRVGARRRGSLVGILSQRKRSVGGAGGDMVAGGSEQAAAFVVRSRPRRPPGCELA